MNTFRLRAVTLAACLSLVAVGCGSTDSEIDNATIAPEIRKRS